MRRGFLLDKPKAKKASQQANPAKNPVIVPGTNLFRYDLQYGKVDYESTLPKDYKPNFNITIDAARGIIKSDRKSMILVTVPPSGSPAAVNRDNHSEWITFEATKPRVFNAPGFPKPMPQPKGGTPLHEVKMTAKMGLGVFARRRIKAGELVFAERPLLLAPINVNILELELGVLLDGITYTKVILDEYEKMLEAAVSRMSEGNQAAYKALTNSHTEDGSGPLTGVLRTNGYVVESIYDGPGTEAAHDGCRYTVIGQIASRINHSCTYNVTRNFDLAAFSFTFKALVDIKVGEQLFCPYCETEAPVAVRQKQLAPYGIACECEICTNATPESDKFRAEYTQRISEFESRNVAAMRGSDNSWPNDKEFKQLLEFQEKAIKECLDNRRAYAHVLSALVIGYNKRNQFFKALEIVPQLERIAAL